MQQGISLVLSFIIILSSDVFTKPAFVSKEEIRKPTFQIESHVYRRVKREEEEDMTENVQFSFDCQGRAMGFYADQEYNCQYFHMCDGEGRRIPYVCANETSFNQEFRICDWEYNFECSEANKWYYLNELTYATESQDEEERHDDDEQDDDADNNNSSNNNENDEVTNEKS